MSKAKSKGKAKRPPKKTGKVFAIILAILLVLALGASMTFNVLMYRQIHADAFDADEIPGTVAPPLDDDNVIVTPIEPDEPVKPVEPSEPDAKPILSRIAMSPRTAVLASDDDVVAVPISVTPDVELPETMIDWAISFKDSTSSWASGKVVTDYATITPTADGALTATLAVKEVFAEQIIVTASVRDNADVKAECTVDYAVKYTLGAIKHSDDMTYLTANVNSTLGTITEDYTVTATMEMSNNGKTFVREFARLLANVDVACSEAIATANFDVTETRINSAPSFYGMFKSYQIAGGLACGYLVKMPADSPANETDTLRLLGVTADSTKLTAIRTAFKKTCDSMSFCTATDIPYSYAIADFATVTFKLISEHSSSTVSVSLMPLFGVTPLVGSLTMDTPSIVI